MNIPRVRRPTLIKYDFENLEIGFWKSVKTQREATAINSASWKRGFKVVTRTVAKNKIDVYFLGKRKK